MNTRTLSLPSQSHLATSSSSSSIRTIECSALVERLHSGLKASTDEHGEINFNWLVMHIWLAQCELIKTAQLSAASTEEPEKAFKASIEALRETFPIALRKAIPLLAEYAEPMLIRTWRDDEEVVEIITDDDFYAKAQEVGLLMCPSDVMWALGIELGERGPRRPVVARKVTPRLH